MIALRDLGATDPSLLFAVGVIVGAIVAIVWQAICNAWDRAGEQLDALIADADATPDLDANEAWHDSRPSWEKR